MTKDGTDDKAEEEHLVSTGGTEDDQQKNKKKKRPREDDNDDDGTHQATRQQRTGAQRQQRRAEERKRLMEQLPKVDPETGAAFSKQQLRRMRKRLKRGLDPIETPRERHERQQDEIELQKQERAMFAGEDDEVVVMEAAANKDDNDDEEEKEEHRDSDGEEDEVKDDEVERKRKESKRPTKDDREIVDKEEDKSNPFWYEKKPQSATAIAKEQQETVSNQNKKKTRKKRNKPVPSDYVCSACQNRNLEHGALHWIYDCPEKKTVRGTNQVSKYRRGLHDPSSCKLFVSGLPFDATMHSVKTLFQEKAGGGVQNCKLVKFPDTGRCKGQAYLTFDTEAHALEALKLDGTIVENENKQLPDKDQKKKKKKMVSEAATRTRRKELKLRVTRVKNRFYTKKNRQEDK